MAFVQSQCGSGSGAESGWLVRLFRFDAGPLDDIGEFFALVHDQVRKGFGRAAGRFATERGEPFAKIGHRQNLVDVGIEALHDGLRCARRREHAEVGTALEALDA